MCLFLLVHLSVPLPECFHYSGLVIQFDIRHSDPSYIALFSEVAAAIRSHLWFHINFCSVCSISVKYAIGTLIRIALNL